MVGTHSVDSAHAQHPGELRIAAKRTRENADRFIEEVVVDDPDLASYLRIEERELEAGGSQTAYRMRMAAVARMVAAMNAISLRRSRRPLTR